MKQANRLYNSSSLSTRLFSGLVATIATLGASHHAYANPQGGTVVGGSANITSSGSTETITQSTNNAIINWQSFNIASGEITKIVEPSAGSVQLDRVTGGSAAQILGTLTANGHVMLVDPNGVFFGKGSQVNVAGLIVSTADIQNSNFMSGNYNFNIAGSPNASIVNQGTITAADGGLVAMIAPGVSNQGIINAKLGKVELDSAQTFNAIDLYGDGLYSFQLGQATTQQALDQNGNPLPSTVSNSGVINAQGGTVQITATAAANLVSASINNTGIINATAISNQGGTIVLDGGEGNVAVSGTLDASGKGTGQTGGTVQVLSNGGDVSLTGATIDASGDVGGGTVNIGGGLHGQGLEQASTVEMDGGSVIDVSAITSGNGGTANLWSNTATNFEGSIYARGGANGGDGGLIETSGESLNVDSNAVVDASAANGNAGTWLLDPYNVLIANEASTGVSGFTATGTPAVVSTSSIDTALSGGSNVTVSTGTGGSSTNGSIEVADSINVTGSKSSTLTLNAATDIIVDAANAPNSVNKSAATITDTGTGKLNVAFNADKAGLGGGIVMNKGTEIATDGGNITFAGAVGDAFTNGIGITLDGATLNAGTGNISLTGTGAPLGAPGVSQAAVGVYVFDGSNLSTTSGNIGITGTGGATTGNWNYGIDIGDASGVANTITSTTGNITLTGNAGTGGQYDHAILLGWDGATTISSTTGSINITGNGGDTGLYFGPNTTIGGNSEAGDITITGNNGIVFDGGAISTTASNKSINITGNGNGISGFTTIGGASGAGDINLIGSSIALSNTTIQTANNVDLESNGSVSLTNDAISGHDVLIDPTFDASSISLSGTTVSAGNDITLTASGDISAFDSTLTTQGGNIALNSNATGGGNGAIVLDGGTSLASNGGNITLGSNAEAATGDAFNANGITLGDVSGNAMLNAGSGNITMYGKGSANGGDGILIQDGSTVTGTSNTIALTGTGGGGTGNGNMGVEVVGNGSLISSGAGNLNINGTGGASTGNTNAGVLIESGGALASTSGNITLTGLGGGVASGTSTDNIGVGVAALTVGDTTGVTSTSGNIKMVGYNGATDGAGDYFNGGIYINAPVSTGGHGSITLDGNTGNNAWTVSSGNGSNNYGITTYNAADITTTGTGSITLTGIGAGSASGTGNVGVLLQNGANISSADDLTISGTGGPSADGASYGISQNASTTAALAGDVTYNGNGGSANADINIVGGSILATAAGKDVTLNGATNDVDLSNTTVTAGNALKINTGGNINVTSSALAANAITAQAGNNIGVSGGSTLQGNTGNITLTATNGDINVSDSALNTGGGANIALTAGNDISITSGSELGNSSGDIDLTATSDDITVSGSALTSTGGNINLTAGFDIGVTDSALSGLKNISLTANGDDVSVSGGSTLTSTGGNVSLTASNDIVVADSSIGTTSDDITLDSNANNSGTGAISIDSNSALTSQGGNIVLGGGSGPIKAGTSSANGSGFAVADPLNGFDFGVNNAGLINAGGGNVTINGQGASMTGDYVGGVMNSGKIETSNGGNVSVTGMGANGTGNDHDGIFQYGTIETVDGDIILNGTGGNGGQYTDLGIRNYGLNEVTGKGNIYATGTSGAGETNGRGIGNYFGTFETNSGNIKLTSNQGSIDSGYSTEAITSATGNITLTTLGGDINETGGSITTGGNGDITFNVDSANNVNLSGATVSTVNGNITIDPPANVSLTNTTMSATGSGNIALAAGNDIVVSGGSLTTQGGDITLDSNANGTNTGGAIALTDTSLTSNGGNIVLGGGVNPQTGFAYGDTTAPTTVYGGQAGVDINASTVSADAGNITVNGVGGTNAQNAGVEITDNGALETTTGNINVTGYGTNTSGYGAYGLHMGDGGTISTGSGNITINGTGATTEAGMGYGNGIELYNNSSIVTNSGTITLNGTAGGTEGDYNFGLFSVNSIAGKNVIGGATDTGNIIINTGNDAVNLIDAAVNTTGNITVDPADFILNASSMNGGNILLSPVGNVTLLNDSTLTASGDLDIQNSGVFYSDTSSVLLGNTVELNQNLPGSIQNAIDAVNPLSGTTLLTLTNQNGGGDTWNQTAVIDGYSNFTLTGDGSTLIQPTDVSGMPLIENVQPWSNQYYAPIVLAENGDNVTVSNLAIDGSQVATLPGGANGFSSLVYSNAGGTVNNVHITKGGNYGLFAIDTADYNSSATAHTVNVDGSTIAGSGWSDVDAGGELLTFNMTGGTLNGTGHEAMDYSNGSTGTFTDVDITNANAVGISFHGAQGVTVSGGEITGTSAGTVGISDDGLAFGVDAASNISISGETISNVGTGIAGNGGNKWSLLDNTITGTSNTVGTGISLNGVTNSVVGDTLHSTDGNTISSFGTGISVTDGTGIHIAGNGISDITTGIYVDPSSDIHIDDNVINASNSSGIVNGIWVDSSSDVTVNGNQVTADTSGLAGTGIMVNNSTDVTVGNGLAHANTVTGFSYGIASEGSSGKIVGNTLNGDAYGVVVGDNTGNVKVDRNTVTGGLDGIVIYDASGVTANNNTITGVSSGFSLPAIGMLTGSFILGAGQGDGIDALSSSALTLSNNTITGTNAGTGISLTDVTNSTVGSTGHANTIKDFETGISVDPSSGVSVDNNTISNTVADGIDVSGGSSITVSDNTINTTGGDGINVAGSAGVVIDGNKVGLLGSADNIQGDGIYVDSSNGAVIESNKISNTFSTANNSGSGIQVVGTDGVTIGAAGLGNTITNIDWDGIRLADDDSASVSDNSVNGVARVGIYFGDVTNSSITHNHVQGATLYGDIYTEGGSSLTISDNRLSDSLADGILSENATGTNSISGNTINGVDGDGVYVYNNTGQSIDANRIGLLGGADNIQGDGIHVDSSNGVVIESNRISNTFSTASNSGSGIHVTNSDGVTIGAAGLGNTVTNTDWDGISLANDSDASVANNRVDGVARVGIYFGNVTTGFITSNHVEGATLYGDIFTNGGSNLSVSDNRLTNTPVDGVMMENATGTNSISGNTIYGVSGDGIYADNDTTLAIDGNNIATAGKGTVLGNGINVNNLSGVTVDNNVIGTYGTGAIGETGINLVNVTGGNVNGNTVENASTGINIDPSSHIRVAGNTISDIVNDGIDVSYSDHVRLYNNTISAVGGDGINANYADHLYAALNTINGAATGNGGIEVDYSKRATISDNTVDNVGFDGIFASDDTNLRVLDNQIGLLGASSIAYNGIEVDGSKNTTIQYNTISNSGADGIYVSGLTGTNLIDTNTISYSANNGIEADMANSISITNNTINNTGTTSAFNGDGIMANDLTGTNSISGNKIGLADVNNGMLDGINIGGSSNVAVGSNQVNDALNGIVVDPSTGITVTNNTLTGANKYQGIGISFDQVGGPGTNTITGNTITDFATAISLTGGSIVSTISGNTINGAGTGFYINDESGITLSGNTIYARNYGIDVENGSSDITLSGNHIFNTGDSYGVNVDNSTDVATTGNDIHGFTTGVEYNASTGSVTDNSVVNSTTGIDITNGSDGVSVSGNTLNAISADGIDISGSTGDTVSGNFIGSTLFSHIGGDAINVSDSSGITVSGNQIATGLLSTVSGDGIDVTGSSTVGITGNQIGLYGSVSNTGIYAGNGSSAITIQGNTVEFAKTGISVSGLTGTNLIDSNTLDYISKDGIDASDDLGLTISNNVLGTGFFSTIGGYGIHDSGDDEVDIVANTVDNASTGIFVSGLTDNNGNSSQVYGNFINHTTNDAIDASNSVNLSVDGNQIGQHGNIGGYGISVSGLIADADGTSSVYGNTVDNTGKSGIYANADTDLAINHNLVGTHGGTNSIGSKSSGTGILVTGDEDVSVDFNTVEHVKGGSGISVSNLTDNGGNGNYILGNQIDLVGGNAITASGSKNLSIGSNLIGQNGGGIGGYGISVSGLTADTAGNSAVYGNTIDNTHSDGIHASGDTSLAINNNKVGVNFGNIGGNGIYASGEENLAINGNTITRFTGAGIDASGLTDTLGLGNTISGNTINSTTGTNGIYVSTAANLSISGNHIGQGTGIVDNGIEVSGLTSDTHGSSSITGNYVDNTQNDDGINASGDTNLSISGNFIGTTGATPTNIAHNGITVSDDTGSVIDNNVVAGVANNGIEVDNSDLQVEGNNLTAAVKGTGIGILLNGVYGSGNLVENNTVADFATGIELENSLATVSGNTIDPSVTGIYITGASSDGQTISGNTIYATTTAIGVNGTNDLTITGNHLFNTNDSYGVELVNSTGTTVASNDIHNFTYGIYVQGGGSDTLNANSIYGASNTGIWANASDDLKVTGNTITGAGTGISVSGLTNVGAHGNLISGNTINTTTADGIDASGDIKLTIASNTIGNAGAGSIGGAGISATDETGLTIGGSHTTGNTVKNTADDGIDVFGTPAAVISYNNLSTIGATGIVVGDDASHTHSDDANISNNTINGAANGINVSNLTDTGAHGNLINTNTIDNITGEGIIVSGSVDLTASGNKIGTGLLSTIGSDAINVSGGSSHITVSNNNIGNGLFDSVGGDGVDVSDSSTVSITGNHIGGGLFSSISGTGVSAANSSAVTIASNTIDFANTGISVSGLTGTNLINLNTLDYITNNGINASGDVGLTISNNKLGTGLFSTIGGIGISDSGDDDVKIITNTVDNAATGISVSGLTDNGGHGNLISGNTIDRITHDGIDASGDLNLTLASNKIGTGFGSTIGGTGISTTGETGLTIGGSNTTGNTVDNTADDGIDVTNATGALVSFNTLNHIGGIGIMADPSSNIDIISNTIKNALTGISVSDLTGTNEIESNKIDGITDDGVDASGDTNLTISSNQIGNQGINHIGGVGISATDETGLTIGGAVLADGNTVENTGGDGIDVFGTPAAVISYNQLATIDGTGILVGNDSATPTPNSSDDVTISNNTITGSATGISVANLTDVGGKGNLISDNTITNTTADGIDASSDVNLTISGNSINPSSGLTQGNGIYVSGDDDVTISGNNVFGTFGTGGIVVANLTDNGGHGNLISGNDIEGAADGISASDDLNLSINSNTIGTHGSISGDGITVSGDTNLTVDSNTIGTADLFGGVGINLVNVTGATVNGNDIENASTGIAVDPSSNIIITGNTVQNTTGDAINVSLLTGTNSISGNFLDFIGGNGITATSSQGLTVDSNQIGLNGAIGGGNYGILGDGISVSGLSNGSSITNNLMDNVQRNGINASGDTGLIISGNQIGLAQAGFANTGDTGNIGGNGINVDASVGNEDNVTISGNSVQNTFDGAGIIVTGLTANTGNNTISGNFLDRIEGDAINASNSASLAITGNQIGQSPSIDIFGDIFGNGIVVSGLTGASSISGNVIDFVSGDGIDVTDSAGLAISNNQIGQNPTLSAFLTDDFNNGISVTSSDGASLTGNTITGANVGINVDTSNNVSFASNVIVNGFGDIGVLITDSTGATITGGSITGNNGLDTGIELNNAQSTFIDGVTLDNNTTGLFAENGSGLVPTLVEDTAFIGGTTGIELSGSGTSLQFVGNTSTFSGSVASGGTMTNYFFLENKAMLGEILDASQQSFDVGPGGSLVAGHAFSRAEYNTAEGQTIDVLDGFPVGLVFYRDFGPLFDISLLDQILRNWGLGDAKFSYAGFLIDNTTSGAQLLGGYSTQLGTTNVSLLGSGGNLGELAPAAGGNGDNGNGDITPDQFGNLNPGAGGPNPGGNAPQGNNGTQLANNNCAASFLSNPLSFNGGNCQ